MAVTAAQVKAFAPAFAAVADSVVNLWLGFAPTFLSAGKLGDDYDQAVLLWTCHQLQSSTGGAAGAGGSVTMRKAGDVEVQYSGTPVGAGTYQTTHWGRMLVLLLRTCAGSPRVL